MSRTSPGRYALHEFAKNVYQVSFENGAGEPLEATRPDLHEWRVAGHDGTVRMTYTLFGDQRDGTYAAQLAADSAVADLMANGNTPDSRAALAEHMVNGGSLAEGLGDDTLDMIRGEMRRFADARIKPLCIQYLAIGLPWQHSLCAISFS